MEYSTRDPVLVSNETDVTPSERVVDAVAAAEDVDPIELDPLYASIDPDALDAVVGSEDAFSQSSTVVSFDYGGYRVTVTGDGDIDLRDR